MPFRFFFAGILLAATALVAVADPPFRADGRPLQHPLRKSVPDSHGDEHPHDRHDHGWRKGGWPNSYGRLYLPRTSSFSYYSYGPLSYSYGPLIGGYYGDYGAFPYGYYCGVCGSAYCTDPYCAGPLYYTLPPRFVTPGEVGYPDPFAAERQFRALAARGGAAAAAPRGVPLGGVGPDIGPGDVAAAEQRPAAEDVIARRVAAIEPSGAAERARADRLLEQGDELFQRQAYLGAENKYRAAVRAAGDDVTARYRLAHALLAKGKYEEALQEFLTAIELQDSIARPNFQLAELYGNNQLAIEADFDALSQAALERGEEGGLLMLVGLMLHYDQQPLRARPFFLRAAQLEGPWQRYAQWFTR